MTKMKVDYIAFFTSIVCFAVSVFVIPEYSKPDKNDLEFLLNLLHGVIAISIFTLLINTLPNMVKREHGFNRIIWIIVYIIAVPIAPHLYLIFREWLPTYTRKR